MYNSVQLGFRYLRYVAQASNGKGHGIHSPFVFEFTRRVLNDNTHDLLFDKIEMLRKQLLKDPTFLIVDDYGAGSVHAIGNERRIADLTKYAAKPKKTAQLLFRIIKYFQPQRIIELGTSLGISAAYIAAANPEATFSTIEGSADIARKAKSNLSLLGYNQVDVINGTFDTVLPKLLENTVVDCVFIDGNHRYDATVGYFDQLLPKTHSGTILIFDDIHWSKEMEKAWEKIKANPAVTCSIDLFFVGIIFFRHEIKMPQHFTIRYPYFGIC
ncbi:MAG TPA: class I SAM-dependent methyltransferase [Flavitalea sp.]|nr:class I SAM-dependent methyltransferase [Flavitalea sp.]